MYLGGQAAGVGAAARARTFGERHDRDPLDQCLLRRLCHRGRLDADRSGERFGDASASVPRLGFAHDRAGIIHAIAPDISATPRENGGLIRRFRNFGGMMSIVSPRGT